jgi:hypothetical protein
MSPEEGWVRAMRPWPERRLHDDEVQRGGDCDEAQVPGRKGRGVRLRDHGGFLFRWNQRLRRMNKHEIPGEWLTVKPTTGLRYLYRYPVKTYGNAQGMGAITVAR